MSGAIGSNGIDYASLFPISSASSNGVAGQILRALYGGGPGLTGSSGVNPIIALQDAQANETTDVANEAKQPQVQQAVAAFTKAVDSATSIKSLLQNPDFLNVFLTANGLGSETAYPALAQQALLSNPSDSGSLANQLSSTNSAWLNTVQTYNFYQNGLAAIQNSKVLSTVANGYAEVQWRESLDRQTPGLSNALYFLQNASSLTSADEVLGNSVARTVVTTAFGIPEQIAYQLLQAQEQAISTHLDFSKMSDSQYVQSITDQYLVQLQSGSSSSASASSVTSLFA
jgi:Protein of unknown function (DUF1217)